MRSPFWSFYKACLLLCCLVAPAHIGVAIKCKKLPWFMAVGRNSRDDYKKFVANALLSARKHAPSLIPHVIYDGVPDNFTAWIERTGGHVCFHQLSFLSALKLLSEVGERTPKAYQYYPPFLRLDLPLVFQTLQFDTDEVETEYVLYTDVDVMFQNDIDSCTLKRPKIMLVGAEFDKGALQNTGIMYLHIDTFAKHVPAMLKLGLSKRFEFVSYDQGLILEYFDGQMELLPDEYNWKAYWGYDRKAVILHFHGPKPSVCLECFLRKENTFQQSCKTCPEQYAPLFNYTRTQGTVSEYSRYMALWRHYLSEGFFADQTIHLPPY